MTSSSVTVEDVSSKYRLRNREVSFGCHHPKDGYIVTNNHVIDGADEINVKLHDGREMKGRVIGTDPTTDLALVKIEGDDFPAIV